MLGKKRICLLFISFLAVCMFTQHVNGSEIAKDGSVGKWVNVDFAEENISDFQGRVVLLEFMATW